jgi:hypothetical protein
VVEIPAGAGSGKLPVIVTSLFELFERLAGEEGLYFRKPGFQRLWMLSHSDI